jgi:aspartyl aminopeptidase
MAGSSIKDFELCLYDTQDAVVGGLLDEFIFAPRLDNLMMSYTSVMGLIRSLEGDTNTNDKTINMVALFDDEEVGSSSAHGAGSK